MGRMTATLVGRRRAVVAVAIVLVVGLGSLSLVFPKPFTPTDLVIPGTESSRWDGMQYAGGFGTNVNVLLRGPAAQLRSQGEALVTRLRRRGNVHVLSPFDPGADQRELRPSRESAILIVDVQQRKSAAIYDAVTPVNRAIDATIRPPVGAEVAGQSATAAGLNEVAYKATRDAEYIAVPVLVLVLLFVFGSPVAAAIPGVVGLATVIAGSGIVASLAATTKLDPVAVSLESMMGLALGVDYSLLLVSRFRELRRSALEDGDSDGDVTVLLRAANMTAGRTIVFAATLLIAEMTAAALLSPGDVLYSVAISVIVVTLVAALISLCVTPCLLFMVAPHLDRWQLRDTRAGIGSVTRVIAGALRHRVIIPALALVGLLALAAPTVGLRTGAPDVRELPPGTPARLAYSDFAKSVGTGFAATLEVLFRSSDGPITTTQRLVALTALQRRLNGDPDVDFTIGPEPLLAQARRLQVLESARSSESRRASRAARSLRSLEGNLARAGRGLQTLQSNLQTAQGELGAQAAAAGTAADSPAAAAGTAADSPAAAAGTAADSPAAAAGTAADSPAAAVGSPAAAVGSTAAAVGSPAAAAGSAAAGVAGTLAGASAGIGTTRSELARGSRALRSYSAAAEEQAAAAKQGEATSPAFARSGYLLLAAIEGSTLASRQQASFVVNAAGGGQYARIVIVPKYGPNDPRVSGLVHRVAAQVGRFARAQGLEAAVGGPAGIVSGYTEVTSRRLPILVICLAAVSFVVLMVILRALVLPIICVLLNALTAGVAFGVMSIGFQGNRPLLSGPGYVDIVSLLGTFTVVFALSIDYQVFLLSRMREEMLRSGDHTKAVMNGIGATASVVTGAAAIMVGVFLAFASSSYIAIREVGVGLAVAVFLDATVVRLVLLPSMMMMVGEKCWWLPEPLARLLPSFEV